MWGARTRDRFTLRRNAEQRGRRSEFWAALLLSCKFYRVLGWRVKTRLGELDLVAMSPDGVLCFIEVKARDAEGSAAEAITVRQRSRIERAAALYLGAHPALRQKAIRFDAILVTPRSWPLHVKDAWRPES
jgi:putative endonuclease